MTTALALTSRLLPPEEWDKVAHVPPFSTVGIPDPDHWRVLVVEDAEGKVVAVSHLYDMVHWDSFWIDPAHQGKAAAFRAMVTSGLETLGTLGIQVVHTTVPNDRPDLQQLVLDFGYQQAPGQLYLLYVPDAVRFLEKG